MCDEENVRCKCTLSPPVCNGSESQFLLYTNLHHQSVCLKLNVRAQNGTQQSALELTFL